MESATFRKWLEEHGCHFEQHERYEGQVATSVTARRLALVVELCRVARMDDRVPMADHRRWPLSEGGGRVRRLH